MQNCLYQKITTWTCTDTLHTLLEIAQLRTAEKAYVLSTVFLEGIDILALKPLYGTLP